MATLEYQTPPPRRSRWWLVLWIGLPVIVMLLLGFVGLMLFAVHTVRTSAPAIPAPITVSAPVPMPAPTTTQPSQ
jgi:hypothetical protein